MKQGVYNIIKNILRMLDDFRTFLNSRSNNVVFSEEKLIERHLRAFHMFSIKAYFKECQKIADQYVKSYGDNFPKEQINLINNRMRKGKIRNSQIYKKVFAWYELFKKGFVLELSAQRIKMLRYSVGFSNRLFELWCLYSIKETFISSFAAILIDEKNVMDAGESYIFKLLLPTGGTLEIYYQKGTNLYWHTEDELAWKYKKDNTLRGLRGIPDISVRYMAREDSLVMIDIKNRVRVSGANSEEIYKMIGYFSNFRKAFTEHYSQNVKKQGALIFRNDVSANNEFLESEDGYRLMIITVGVNSDSEVNDEQFKRICKYILDVQGIDGTVVEIIDNFSSIQKNIGNVIDLGSDKYIFELSEKNHFMIQQLFSYGELAEQLPEYESQLKENHFPHIWDQLSQKTRRILAMAECLYSGLSECGAADYAPICLEYCRALEVEMNELIFTPFKAGANIEQLSRQNYFYDRLKDSREMTLGECIYLLNKCKNRKHPLSELWEFIQANVKQCRVLLNVAADLMRELNENIRRLSAHTTVMSYSDLVLTRQIVLGIGNVNLLYVLRDDR